MNMLHALKNTLYQLKLTAWMIFTYPKSKLRAEHANYDMYWKEKRQDEVVVLSSWQKNRADLVLDCLRGEKDAPLYVGDIGCGDGAMLQYLKENMPSLRAVGYDISTLTLKRAAEAGIEVRELDIRKDEELSKLTAVDYYFLFEVLEHVPAAEKVLAAAYARASKGVLFSVPNSGYFAYRLRLLFGKFPLQWVTYPTEHLRFWTGRDMDWWLTAQEYPRFTVRYYKGVPLLNRLFPRLFAMGMFVHLKKTA